ncbi:MAG: hypothetical protein ACI38A_01880 [Candidatus Ornithomonoglobus sp.]
MTTLTRKQYKVLKFLISKASENPSKLIELSNDFSIKGLSPYKVHNILSVLADAGYIQATFFDTSVSLHLTASGFEYPDSSRLAYREKLYELLMSKGVDIAVAGITAVITYFVMPCIMSLFHQ